VFADESPDWNLDFDGTDMCDECQESPAVVHLLRIDSGGVEHTRLCQRCAENIAGRTDGGAVAPAVLSSFQGFGLGRNREGESFDKPDSLVCGVCGTTLSDVKETGMVGCSLCYQVFAGYLQAQLFDDAEPTAHLGKSPGHESDDDKMYREKLRLQHMLKELVECERFEEAAGVRDRLAEIAQSISAGGE
jgi:protein arginine kinase activator